MPSVAATERNGASLKQLIYPPLAEKAAALEAEEAFTRRVAQADRARFIVHLRWRPAG